MKAWQVYRQPRLLLILLLGFSSGLPLALTGATLAVRLTEAGVSLTAIGIYALVQLSYNFKVLWAPFLDTVPVPFLTRALGLRRSWLIVLQICLAGTFLGLGSADPRLHPEAAVLWAIALAFFSASQDVVIDAFRVELLNAEEQGGGAAATQMGYRLGMIVSGAGALYLAGPLGWQSTYGIMALLLGIGVAATLTAPNLAGGSPSLHVAVPVSWSSRIGPSVLAPFIEILKRRGWPLLFAFIIAFNLGQAMAGHMANPLYIKLGFSKAEIASISKLLGTMAAMVGVGLGGMLVYRLGVIRALLVGAGLQILSTLLYVVQVFAGHDLRALTTTIVGENLAGGVGSAAFVAFLSDLCDRRFTATQYALLSALALLGRNLFAAPSGWLAQTLGWEGFFVLASTLGVPGLLLVFFLNRYVRTDTGPI